MSEFWACQLHDTVPAQAEHLAEVLDRHAGEEVAVITYKAEEGQKWKKRLGRLKKRATGVPLTDDDKAPLDYAEELRRGLTLLGYKPDLKRITWLTWGAVEGRNDVREASVVYMAGVMMRDRETDLLPTALGMLNDIEASISTEELTRIEQSEAAHLIYQGALRACSRRNVDGVALPSTVYVTHAKAEAITMVSERLHRLPKMLKEKVIRPVLNSPKQRGVDKIVEILQAARSARADEYDKTKLRGIVTKELGKKISRQTWTRWLADALSIDAERHLADEWEIGKAGSTHLIRVPGFSIVEGGYTAAAG